MKTKTYQKNEHFSILWTPEKCIHAGVCVKLLPQVYHPKDKPWITPENAEVEDLKRQIEQCPSGALGYKEN